MSSDGGPPNISTDQFQDFFLGIGVREAYNEATGFNRKREETYKKRVVSEAEAAKKDIEDKENMRKGFMDMLASQMGGSIRRRSQAKGSTSSAGSTGRSPMSFDMLGGQQDFLGLS